MANARQHIHDAVIIGGGHNGLVCAAYLAQAGLDVQVLERRHMVGGACATEEIFPGYHVSTCSYVVYILQDKIVQDLELRKHGYDVHPLPIKRLFPLPDGRKLIFWNDTARTCRDIEALFTARDARGFAQIQDFWKRAGRLLEPFFLAEPPTLDELQTRVQGTEDEALLETLLNTTLTELVDDLFDSDEVKAAAVSHIMPSKGMDEPGVLLSFAATKPHVLVDPDNQGIAVGGMGGLSNAIARSAQAAGARIRCGAEVKRMLPEKGQAVGVELRDGQIIRSRIVISNADPKRTFLHLVGEEHLEPVVADEVNSLETACATLKFHGIVDELPDFSRYLGADADPKLIATVGITPTIGYYRRAIEDALAGRITDCPVIDVQIPTVYDKTIAPEGKHIVSMWVRFYPVHPEEGTWDALRETVGNQLIDLITEYAPNFRASLIDWLVYTPADMEQRLHITDGNFRHTDHTASQLLAHRLFSRGGHRTPIPGLYMCGAGTHPGGDVSGAPGHNAAQVVLGECKEARHGR